MSKKLNNINDLYFYNILQNSIKTKYVTSDFTKPIQTWGDCGLQTKQKPLERLKSSRIGTINMIKSYNYYSGKTILPTCNIVQHCNGE